MEINKSGINNPKVEKSNLNIKNTEKVEKNVTKKSDSLNLSTVNLLNKIKEDKNIVDSKKIENIKNKIINGEYKINPEKVSESIIKFENLFK